MSEDNCFVIDLEDDSDVYLKCVDVFAQLIQHIQNQENFTEQSLVEFLSAKYPDVESALLQRDVGSFIQFLKEKNFLSE